MTNLNMERFIMLADRLIAILKPLLDGGPDWQQKQARIAMENINAFREQAANGKLPASNGAGLGITRALGEWAPDDAYEAGYELERFFLENM